MSTAGLRISGRSPDGKFVEIAELPDHPWYLAVQFHPEFQSRPLKPHPLSASFIERAIDTRRDSSPARRQCGEARGSDSQVVSPPRHPGSENRRGAQQKKARSSLGTSSSVRRPENDCGIVAANRHRHVPSAYHFATYARAISTSSPSAFAAATAQPPG